MRTKAQRHSHPRTARRILLALACALALGFAGCENGDFGGATATNPAGPAQPTDLAMLGRALFFDASLSAPAGQSCSSCHDPAAGLADPDFAAPVSDGAVAERVGKRNAQTVAYATFTPALAFDPTMRPGIMEGMYKGGLFWDGRADTLEDQAREPFLNMLEMNNPDKAAVLRSVAFAPYADSFELYFGAGVLNARTPADVDFAYECVAEALAEFMRSPEVSPFTSKYDAWRAGNSDLAAAEVSGYQLFTSKALCFRCHPEPLFTNFGHQNLGTPANPNHPFYALPPDLNPDGAAFVDKGLGDVLRARGVAEADAAKQDGKFKIPCLRNSDATPPYVHNGFHATLRDVVVFNNTRDVPGAGTPPPEVAANVHRHMPPMPGTFGQIGLTDQEMDDLVAFLGTLTDGWFAPTAGNRHPVADAGPDMAGTVGMPVALNGGMSQDPDGAALTYRWSFVTLPLKPPMGMGGMPMASAAAFDNPAAQAPTFVPDLPGIYDIALTVTDGELSRVDLMQVNVAAAAAPMM